MFLIVERVLLILPLNHLIFLLAEERLRLYYAAQFWSHLAHSALSSLGQLQRDFGTFANTIPTVHCTHSPLCLQATDVSESEGKNRFEKKINRKQIRFFHDY